MSLQNIVKKIFKRQCNWLTSELNACQGFAIWRRNRSMVKTGAYDNEGYKHYKEYYGNLSLPAPKSDYIIFSPSLPKNIIVTPEIIVQNLVMPIMNPLGYRGFYDDKNNFDRVLDPDILPQTVLRRIDGFFYNKNYINITINDDKDLAEFLSGSESKRLIIKPSVDSSSGTGVQMISRTSTGSYVLNNEPLTIDILKNVGRNFIIQEAVAQSEYMSQFNPTSVNTLRITTYRSVTDNQIKILWHFLRIGAKGAIVDNAHAGGAFIGINKKGELGKFLKDQYNNTYTSHNDIDFSKSDFVIPEWERVLEFAKEVSGKILHHRYIQLDIMIDSTNTPRLIEYNLGAPGIWAAMMTGQGALGNYSDEILNYCKSHRDTSDKVIYTIA